MFQKRLQKALMFQAIEGTIFVFVVISNFV